ncbi:MAG TPA: transposase, partial [Polyangiales bacterium]|nr:transposase [Polyangiales bacterium]
STTSWTAMAPRPVAAHSCATRLRQTAVRIAGRLHPACSHTRAGGLDPRGREKLLCYVLRPPIANKRIEQRPNGLVRIALKRAFADGTLAVEMDPLSLLCRLATSVPPPRFHAVKYAGVLASASNVRARIKPRPQPIVQLTEPDDPPSARGSAYRAWAELLRRTFDIDVLECPKCHGRMKLIALVLDLQSAARYSPRSESG